MDRNRFVGLVLVAAAAVMIPASESRAVDSGGLKLTRPMVLEGIYLRAAVYDVQWYLEGIEATVTFSRKRRAVATVHGELSTFDRTVVNNTVYFSKYSDGFFHINALGFAKTNKGILFPVRRSRPNPTNNIPVDNTLVEDDRNRPQSFPRVYR